MTHTMTIDRETLLKLYNSAPDSDTKELIRDLISTIHADAYGENINVYWGEGWSENQGTIEITDKDVEDFGLEGWEKEE